MGLEEDVGPFRQKISMATATNMHAHSKFDNENVEDLLTCKAGLKADRPQSSGSAGPQNAYIQYFEQMAWRTKYFAKCAKEIAKICILFVNM